MSDVIRELEAMIAGMSAEQKAELDTLLEPELAATWLPNPGPQTQAYYSPADMLLYGGAAGGGKTDLLIGLATSEHRKAVIFRRAYVDLKGVTERLLEVVGTRQGYNGQNMVWRRDGRLLEFGALEKPGAEKSWQGRDHDFIGFDEGAQLSVEKVQFVIGWLRSASPNQRKRIVIASNPPIGGEGEWLIDWFAPWLDPLFPNPAVPGEIRWAIIVGTETRWVDGPEVVYVNGEAYTPLSRTFIPARLDDNPFLKDTGYRSQIQNMPEPLRSQLLHGDFLAGREDHAWQVIPSAWIDAAQERWKNAPKKRRTMVALSADVSGGGQDPAAIARLHEDAWFDEVVKISGDSNKDPANLAASMVLYQRDGADLSVDGTGGWGLGVRSQIVNHANQPCEAIVYSKGSEAKTADGKLGFLNLRAEMVWRFREALDPENGEEVMLPPSRTLKAQLTVARYTLRGTRIVIEDKKDIRKRLGCSTDEADCVMQAWRRRTAAIRRSKLPDTKALQPNLTPTPDGWMG